MDSRDLIIEYESRMRAMERELEERRLQNLCRIENEKIQREFEAQEKSRRQKEELLRLSLLQEEARRRFRSVSEEQRQYRESYYPSYRAQDTRQREYEYSQLQFLQEQIRQQELENERLKMQIQNHNYNHNTYNYNYNPSPYPPNPYPPQPQAEYPHYQAPTPNIYVTQNTSMPERPAMPLPEREVVQEQERDQEFRIVLPEIEEEEDASFLDEPSELFPDSSESDDSSEAVLKPRRLTFEEAYEILSKPQKKYCDSLRAYAIEKSGAKESLAKYHLSVGNGQKIVVKFMIKNGTTVTFFRLEDERLRRLRRTATTDGAEIKVKETILNIVDDISFQTAKEMIDLRLVQLEENKEYQKLQASNRRKEAKDSTKTSIPPVSKEKSSLEENIARLEANLANMRRSNNSKK
ncbi:MAG: hypothetical protein K2K48_00820 [Anaeroplasmataceae bacterium]|nr:hypothetical protein [Anaeroplasmataceae bacterium]